MSEPDKTKQIVDLDALGEASIFDLSITTPEHPDVRSSKLRREDKEHTFTLVVRGVLLAALLAAGIYGLVIISLENSTPESKDLARIILPAVVTGFLGFALGQRK